MVYKLPEILDDTFEATPPLMEGLSQLVFDASSVRRVSSAGIKRWIEFQRHLPSNVFWYCERVSPAMFRQFLMVRNFLPADRIHSVLAPVQCERCRLTEEVELSLKEVLGFQAICHCGGTQTADIPDEYHFYLRAAANDEA